MHPRVVAHDQEMYGLEGNLLPKPTRKIRRKVFVLHGLGSSHKTQLAIEFAQRSQKIFSSIFWQSGDSRESMRQTLCSDCSKIAEDQISNWCRKFFRASLEELNKIIGNMFFIRSVSHGNSRWLLLFDSVDRDHFLDTDNPQSFATEDFFPEVNHGSILDNEPLRTASATRAG